MKHFTNCLRGTYILVSVLFMSFFFSSLSAQVAAPVDIGIVEILSPGNSLGQGEWVPVQVVLKNFGSDTLLSASIGFEINAVSPTTFTWAGSLSMDETDTVTIGNFTIPSETYEICVWTILVPDTVTENDSVCETLSIIPALDAGIIEINQPSGTYTEGDQVDVIVEIKNFGVDSLFAFDIVFSVNGGTNVSMAWSDTLAPGENSLVTLPSVIIPLGSSEICAHTVLIGDQQAANDSLCKNFYGNPLHDAGMVEILSLPQISGEYNVYARIVNAGPADLLTVDLGWEINSIAQDTVNWTGILSTNDVSDLILLGNYIFADTTYNIKVNTSMPNGIADVFNSDDTLQTDMEFIATAIVDTFPYCESFEDTLGNWIQNTWDDMDWIIDANGTPSNNTGPSSAFDGIYYLFTESNGQSSGDIAGLEAMFDLSTFTYPKISFSYHMYGFSMGTLHMDLFDSIWHEDVWVISGNKGNQWGQANVNIFEYSGMDKVVVRFRGQRGNGISSDMAIDNFCMNEGISIDLSLNSLLSPNLNICASASESVFVEVENFGGNTLTDIPFVLELINPLGAMVVKNDTLWGDLVFGNTDTIEFSAVDFSMAGSYSLTCYFTMAGDQVTSNDTISTQIESIQTISSLPFADSLETGNPYFLLNFSTLSYAEHTGDSLNSYLRLTGGNANAGWSGNQNTTTAQNAWVDNVTHHSTATTCNIDATLMNGITLEFDLKQTGSFLPYSWFRVLINDTVQLSDIFGNTNFNPTTLVNDTFATKTFNLNAYAGTNFTLTFQAACKYDNTYNPGSYPEGDQALIDNIKLFEPLALDASVFSINDPSGSSCGSASLPINIVLANYGLSSIFNVPVDITITFPDNSQQFLSVVFADTLLTGQMVNYTVGSVNTSVMPGNYQVEVSTALVGDGDPSNNSQTANFHSVGIINSIPFEEIFPTATTDYFNISTNSLASAYYFNDSGDTVLRLEGKTNASWTGNSGSVTPTNAWVNNVLHQANVNTCGVDASGYSFLNLDIDFRQTGITTITDYSWFRVLVNDTIQLADVLGVSNFNPTNAQGDPYQIRTFSLNEFAGAQFTLTLQSSCKYDSTLTSGGTNWVEGDAVYIRNIRIYEPPPIDISLVSLSGVPDPSCDLGLAALTVDFINNGTDTILAGTVIPFSLGVNGVAISEGMTLANPMAYGEFGTYTFNFQPDFSTDGEYEISVWSSLPGDSTFVNDTLWAYTLNNLTIGNFPYMQDFETNSEGWVAETLAGSAVWELGSPAQTILDTAHSGVNAWMTGLDNDYPTFSEMHLYTPCFDFIGLQNIMVSFWLNFDSETDYDGMVLEGSSDGIIWSKVGLNDPAFYNSTNNASGSPVLEAPWWSGSMGGWTKITGTLNEFAGETGVRLRFRFKSDNGINSEGFAMDDFFVDELFACNISGTDEICEGESIALTVDASGGEEPYTYQWAPSTGLSDDAIANPMASPVTTTTYNVIVTDAFGEQVASEITITVLPAPVVDLGADITGNPPFVLDAGVGYTAYFWSTFGTDQVEVISQSGSYSVTVTDANGCQGADTINVTVLGVDELTTGAMLIYPNPTTGLFYCSFHLSLIEKANLIVTNILGEKVYELVLPGVSYNQKIKLDLAGLAEGTYLVYLKTDQINQVQKLVIQK